MSTSVNFKLQVSLRRGADDAPVFRKQDGDRFDHNITIKLNLDTTYSVFLTTRPAKSIRSVLLKGEKLQLDQPKPGPNDDHTSCVYHGDWSTHGCDVTKSNARTTVPIVVEMADGARMQIKLQTKFYPKIETTHSKWGQEFHLLELDCSQRLGQPIIDVLKELYI